MRHAEQVWVRLARDVSAPSRGRDAVRSLLGANVPTSFTSDAVLATSELVTNALLHAGGVLDMLVQFDRERCSLRVEVSDSSSDVPRRREPVPDEVGGLGLR